MTDSRDQRLGTIVVTLDEYAEHILTVLRPKSEALEVYRVLKAQSAALQAIANELWEAEQAPDIFS